MPPRIVNEVIAEQLGALRENMERGREDRHDLKTQITELRQAINGLQQSSITANGILAELAKQNLGERVVLLEGRMESLVKVILTVEQANFLLERVKRWDGWVGDGKWLLLKVIGGLLGSGAFVGLVAAAALKLVGTK